MNSRDKKYYDSRLQDIKLEDITSSPRNIHVLEKFRRGDPNFTKLCVDIRLEDDSDSDDDYENEEYIEYETDYEGGDDLGWLGYFIGRSEHLKELHITDLPYHPADSHIEQMNALTREISRNRSIVELAIQHDIGDIAFRNMCSFVGENNNLRKLELHHMKPGNESIKHFALVLEQRQCNSLQELSFDDNDFVDPPIEAIAAALSRQAALERLELKENYLGATGCAALGTTLSTWQAPKLKILNFYLNCIDDAGLEGLVAGLVNCTKLEELILSYNPSITAAGLRSLAALFQSEHCCLKKFRIDGVHFGDEGAIALADALVGNTSLEEMSLYIRPDYADDEKAFITQVGWSAFTDRLLCDTSSAISTYQSNHTLVSVTSDDRGDLPSFVEEYLQLNRFIVMRGDVKVDLIAVIKILTHHTDLEMESFFKWDLKCLPIVVTWFQMVRDILDELDALQEENMSDENIWNEVHLGLEHEDFPMFVDMAIKMSQTSQIDSMELSSIFKFVRAMPKLVVNSIRGKGKGESRKRKASD